MNINSIELLENYIYTNLFVVVHWSTILDIKFPRQNFTTALLSFLFLSATVFKNILSVSGTSIHRSIAYHRLHVCIFFLIQNTLISSKITTRKIKMKRFILILGPTVHTTSFTILQKLFILRFIVTLLLVYPGTSSLSIFLSSYRND